MVLLRSLGDYSVDLITFGDSRLERSNWVEEFCVVKTLASEFTSIMFYFSSLERRIDDLTLYLFFRSYVVSAIGV